MNDLRDGHRSDSSVLRLCASTPAQIGIFSGFDWGQIMDGGVPLKGRSSQGLLHRADCTRFQGLEVESPGGAFYMFVRLTDEKVGGFRQRLRP